MWVAAVLLAATAPALAQDDGCGVERPGGCAPGTGWNYTQEACVGCPEGKYSAAGEDCSFCPHGLEPTPNAVACGCKSHYFGATGNSSMDPENMRCASCADVGGDLATQVRQVSCEPCSSNIAAGADERDCIGMGTCECAGGAPGARINLPRGGLLAIHGPRKADRSQAEPGEVSIAIAGE